METTRTFFHVRIEDLEHSMRFKTNNIALLPKPICDTYGYSVGEFILQHALNELGLYEPNIFSGELEEYFGEMVGDVYFYALDVYRATRRETGNASTYYFMHDISNMLSTFTRRFEGKYKMKENGYTHEQKMRMKKAFSAYNKSIKLRLAYFYWIEFESTRLCNAKRTAQFLIEYFESIAPELEGKLAQVFENKTMNDFIQLTTKLRILNPHFVGNFENVLEKLRATYVCPTEGNDPMIPEDLDCDVMARGLIHPCFQVDKRTVIIHLLSLDERKKNRELEERMRLEHTLELQASLEISERLIEEAKHASEEERKREAREASSIKTNEIKHTAVEKETDEVKVVGSVSITTIDIDEDVNDIVSCDVKPETRTRRRESKNQRNERDSNSLEGDNVRSRNRGRNLRKNAVMAK